MSTKLKVLSNYETAPDEELMASYQKGDLRAFEVLLGRHQKGIYNFLYRSLREKENASEAFQEVFERVIRSASAYLPTARFTTWLYTIARNYCIDLSRKARFRRTWSLDDSQAQEDGFALRERLADAKPGPVETASAVNLEEKLAGLLDQINPDQREVFLLREMEGLPFEEISAIVGASVNTVKSRMRYALSALQNGFKKLGITDR